MVTRILKSAGSCRSALNYNESKVSAAEAMLVGVRNIPSSSRFVIYETFRKYESNSEISGMTKNLSFHMAVNPSQMDAMEERDIPRYIDEIMEGLGYTRQPYVIYRHNDIERSHYHVVSCRVNDKGRVVSDAFERRRLRTMNDALSEKYGFVVGSGEKEKKKKVSSEDMSFKRVTYGEPDLVQKMRSALRDAVGYKYTDESQLSNILFLHGLSLRHTKRTKSKKKSTRSEFGCCTIAENGEKTSRIFNCGTTLKVPLKPAGKPDRTTISSITNEVEKKLALSDNFGIFEDNMRKGGYFVFVSDSPEKSARTVNVISLKDRAVAQVTGEKKEQILSLLGDKKTKPVMFDVNSLRFEALRKSTDSSALVKRKASSSNR